MPVGQGARNNIILGGLGRPQLFDTNVKATSIDEDIFSDQTEVTAVQGADLVLVLDTSETPDKIKFITQTNLTSGFPVLTGSTNNTVVTVTGAETIAGEANLLFDGTILTNDGGEIDIDISSGDPHLSFQISGTDKFTIGVDDNDSDKLKIDTGGTVGGATKVTIDSSGNVTTAANLTVGNLLKMPSNTASKILVADGTSFEEVAIGDLSEISSVADDDVFIAIDTDAGSLKKIARSTLVSGLATSSALANVVDDSTPQLGGNLDMNGNDIVTTSNASIDLAPNGTGTVVIRGNDNQGTLTLNCENNSHGQKIKAAPHSESASNTLTLPSTGGDSRLVSAASTATLTNKTLTTPKIAEIDSLSSGNIVLDAEANIEINADGGTITFKDDSASLGTITSSGYSGTAAVATTVTITDNESTDEDNAIVFTAGGDVDGGNLGLESDGTMTYNPSTGKITATGFVGALTGNADTATALATGRTIGMTGDVVWTSASFTGAGDVTGSATIQAGAVEHGMLADDIISGQAEITSGFAAADELMYSDAGTIKRVGLDTLATKLFSVASAGTVAQASDHMLFLDNGATGDVIVESIGDFLSAIAGSGISVSSNQLTASGSDTVDMGDGFVIEDGDGTEVTITENKEIKFVEGGGIDINFTDTDNGTDGDPFDLTFTIDAAQTGITSIHATDLIIGEDAQTAIDFGTANEIDFKVDNANRLTLDTGALYPATNNQIDLGTASLEFKDAYFDGTVTADAFAGPLTGNADTATLATTVTITDNESTDEDNAIIFTAGGDVDGGNLGLESDGTLTYNPSTGKITATGFVGALTGNADTATLATTVTITDNENTNEDNAIIFTAGGDVDGGNLGLESDGNLTYNPSTGRLTATQLAGTLQTAAQANITSVGTLSGLTIADGGNIGSASDTNAIGISSGGVISITATTANTDASDGALTVAGGASVAADFTVGDDLRLLSDSSVLSFGADSEATITHADDAGLTFNSDITMAADKSLKMPQGANIKFTDAITQDSIDDHDAQGIIMTFTAGSTITPFSPVYIHTDDEVHESNANDPGTMPAIGVSVNTSNVTDGNSVEVMVLGLIRDESFTDFGTNGAPLFCTTTAGVMSNTAPTGSGDILQVIGHSIGEKLVFVQPSLTTAELA